MKRTPDDFAAEMKERLNDRSRMIPAPKRMRHLPISENGWVVPYFVANVDGHYDFRAIEPGRITKCVKQNLCWLCGQTLGTRLAFTLGPMCAVNRISSEPPAHRECAEYAVRVCPFLTDPERKRNTRPLTPGAERLDIATSNNVAGVAIARNPGAVAIWMTRTYKVFKPDPHKYGYLFKIGPPLEVAFYCQGRTATREEILASIDSGLPLLQGIAKAQGREAQEELEQQYKKALQLLPVGL